LNFVKLCSIGNRPDKKYEDTIAFGALLEHLWVLRSTQPSYTNEPCRTEDALTSSSALPDLIVDPKDGLSNDPNRTAFNRAYKTELPFFEWFDLPEQARRMARFAIAMHAGSKILAPDAIVQG
jgi:hypothetical protein